MNILTNVSWLARHAAVFAAGVALIAATTSVADARGSGGSASHSSHSFSAMPMKQGKSYQGSSATGKKHAGKKHEGKKHEGKKHEGEGGKDHDGSRQSKNGCKKNCEGGKDSIVITNGAGKVLYRLPKQQGEERETAQAIPGGILITIGNNSYKIAGTSVTVKNFALSQAAADKAGLTQTIKKNKDGSISDVLTVAAKP